jgi:hypothetical protein
MTNSGRTILGCAKQARNAQSWFRGRYDDVNRLATYEARQLTSAQPLPPAKSYSRRLR